MIRTVLLSVVIRGVLIFRGSLGRGTGDCRTLSLTETPSGGVVASPIKTARRSRKSWHGQSGQILEHYGGDFA